MVCTQQNCLNSPRRTEAVINVQIVKKKKKKQAHSQRVSETLQTLGLVWHACSPQIKALYKTSIGQSMPSTGSV